MKKEKAALAFKSFFCRFVFLIGLFALCFWAYDKFVGFPPFADMDDYVKSQVMKVIVVIGGMCFVLGLIASIVCSRKTTKLNKKIQEEKDAMTQANNATSPDVQAADVGTVEQLTASNNGPIVYIPSMQAYTTVNVGDHQTIDEKFEQIARMDKTQFVVYVARLFSRQGYSVKLTPVLDNYCVDMVVERNGVAIAVGVVLSTRLLTRDDIAIVAEGRKHYPVNNAMVLTNLYFDTTAVEFARQQCMSLVDRNILANQFMA